MKSWRQCLVLGILMVGVSICLPNIRIGKNKNQYVKYIIDWWTFPINLTFSSPSYWRIPRWFTSLDARRSSPVFGTDAEYVIMVSCSFYTSQFIIGIITVTLRRIFDSISFHFQEVWRWLPSLEKLEWTIQFSTVFLTLASTVPVKILLESTQTLRLNVRLTSNSFNVLSFCDINITLQYSF